MLLQYASDLHLEFPANKAFLIQNPIRPKGEVLVLAGDIVPFNLLENHKDFFSYLSDSFEMTWWLPGNHEYYHFDIAEKSGVLNESIRSNVFLVNNYSVVHKSIRLLFSTLWSKISPAHQWMVERSLNDFHLIKKNGFRFSFDSYNQLHEECVVFIQNEMKTLSEEKMTVFTHHCPTFSNYPPHYKGDVLNEAFAVELHDLIASSNITHWVYGHHHWNTPEFCIGNTKLLTNQLGYVQKNEQQLFKTDRCIEF